MPKVRGKAAVKIKSNPVWDYFVIFLGTAVMAAAIVLFIRPANVPLGGATGIALVLNYLFGLPVGASVIALNVPLMFIAWKSLGRTFLFRTAFATVVSSLLIDALEGVLKPFTDDALLSSLYGGVMMGIGLGLIFGRGATSGGSDIIAKYFQKKTGRSIGNVNLIINIAVILAATVIYRKPEAALYAIIIQFCSSTIVDSILSGMDNAVAAFIITADPERVSGDILETMRRGVTAIEAQGMYSGSKKSTLLCAVRSHEVMTLKKVVASADAEAFMIMTNAKEVMGTGFKQYGQ